MKRLILTILFLVLVSNLGLAQGIRAATDTVSKPVHKTIQTITPDTYTGRQILVGSGGGFTGFTTTYYLFENGKLFCRRSRDTTYTLVGQQPTAKTKALFSTIEGTCKIKKTTFQHPGDLYKFVRWRKGKQSYRVSWGMPGHTVPATYLKFYNSFMTLNPASAKLK